MQNQTIVVYENADWYDEPDQYKDPNYYNYTFPEFKDPENETVQMRMSRSDDLERYGYEPNYMNFDPETKVIHWDKTKIKRTNRYNEEYYMPNRVVTLELEDEYGNIVNYAINFKIIWIG